MPPLRQREATAEAQLVAFEAELTDTETYVTLALSLEGFLAKLHEAAHTLALADRQRVVRLILKEVQVGPDTLVLRHSIPVPGTTLTRVIYCVGGVTTPPCGVPALGRTSL